ncbi:MAG TPA: hypothetical protein VEU11_20030, partial [Terriglobales bacterium]|nr:hypothetical protein [Terriglobales bacterium]
ERDTLFPSSSHTGLLWALESLAWDPEYLGRVTLDLARLARIDPGGRLANRPVRSLSTVFKAWMPQTNASLKQRMAAIDQIILKVPEIGWELVLGLLPVRPDSSMPTSRPRLREAGASIRETLTNGLVFATYREIVSRAMRLAKGDPGRLLVLVQSMAPFELAEMVQVCDEIERLSGYSGNQQTELWTGLREVVSRHATYEGAQWALPAAITDKLRVLQKRLEPTDTVLKIKWLFDEHLPDLPNVKGAERLNAVEEARVSALRSLRSEQGDRGIVELAREARFPGLVGNATAALLDDVENFDSMIRLAFVDGTPDPFPIALSSIARNRFGTEWEVRIAARAYEGFSPHQLATLLLAWDNERAAWDLAASLGEDTVRDYWSRRVPLPVRGETADLERAGREYLRAGRALAAIHSLSNAADKLSGELVLKMLDRALDEIAASGRGFDRNIAYEIEAVFDKLDARNDMEVFEVAKREFAYLPLLSHGNRSLNLHRMMADDPNFFVSVLCTVFKPASGGEGEPSAETKARAQHGFELLATFTLVPGYGERPDEAELQKWVTEVRRIAEEQDRARIADQYIGQVLSHSPVDPDDNAWPHRRVRDLLETLQSDEIENGVELGRHHMLGAHAIDPKNPAAAERRLAAEARGWATATVIWPRTTAMLRGMASHWESLADAMEEQARQEAMRD